MPKQTFYNLNQDKRNRVIAAIRDELERVPFAEVSINNIVKSAHIPKGSFYQYFENLEDAIKYVIKDYTDMNIRALKQSLEINGLDIVKTISGLFENVMEYSETEQFYIILKNMYASIKVGNLSQYDNLQELSGIVLEYILPKIKQMSFKIESEENFLCLIEMLMLIFRNALVNIFYNKNNLVVLKEKFYRKLSLLQKMIKEQFVEYEEYNKKIRI